MSRITGVDGHEPRGNGWIVVLLIRAPDAVRQEQRVANERGIDGAGRAACPRTFVQRLLERAHVLQVAQRLGRIGSERDRWCVQRMTGGIDNRLEGSRVRFPETERCVRAEDGDRPARLESHLSRDGEARAILY